MNSQAIKDHLERLTRGDVLFDDVSREVYSTAACLYRIKPLGVVRPRSALEVARIIQFCSQEGIPITARGAGSGAAGQAIGEGVILDFTRFMNRLVKIDPDRAIAHVEPGLIFSRLNQAAEKFKLHFPPDPSSGSYASLGGMIANNSSGPHSIKYGSTRNYVYELEVVLADGTIAVFSEKDINAIKTKSLLEESIYREVVPLLRSNAALIESYRPRGKNSSGYLVWDVLEDDKVDLVKLITGSEGTLAIVTGARIRILPLPRVRLGALFFFDQLDKAGEAIARILHYSPAALEIMDKEFTILVREHRPELRELLPEKLDCLLLVEFEADSHDQARVPLRELENDLVRERRLAFGFRPAKTERELTQLWEVRKAASPILYRARGPGRMARFVEDIVIPPDNLVQGLKQVQEILAHYGTTAPILGHAGDGNLHLNPRLDLEKPEDRKRMQEIAEEIYQVVIALGGSISGEHGDGILRAPYVKRQFGELYQVFREIKRIFDSQNILNPGKIFRNEDRVPVSNLRFNSPDMTTSHPFSRELWSKASRELILACHGCGLCRTYCPAFLADEREEFLPRSKASMVRALAREDLGIKEHLESGNLDAILDACYSCQRCLRQCPTGVEVARLVQKARAERRKSKGFSVRDYSMGRIEQILRMASLVPSLEKPVLDSSLSHRLLSKTLGMSKDAPIPRVSMRLTLDKPKRIIKPKVENSALKVLYYPGCLDRYASEDGSVKEIMEILRRTSSELEVPDLPCCGLPLASTDDLAAARERASRLAQKLKPYLDAGFLLVTACPGCALTFRYEYPIWLGHEGELIAGATKSFFEFLAGAIRKSDEGIKALSPEMSLAYHRPCHEIALNAEDHVAMVLERIPGLNLHFLPDLCCGLGGVFGVKKETESMSRKIGQALAEAIKDSGLEMVTSSCGLCRLQIARLGFKVIRPEKILARVFLK